MISHMTMNCFRTPSAKACVSSPQFSSPNVLSFSRSPGEACHKLESTSFGERQIPSHQNTLCNQPASLGSSTLRSCLREEVREAVKALQAPEIIRHKPVGAEHRATKRRERPEHPSCGSWQHPPVLHLLHTNSHTIRAKHSHSSSS